MVIRLAAWAAGRLFGRSSISLTQFQGNFGIDNARISTLLNNGQCAPLTTQVSNSALTRGANADSLSIMEGNKFPARLLLLLVLPHLLDT